MSAYKRYPFRVPLRVKFFNLFRYIFQYPFPEKLLVSKLGSGKSGFWKRLIPPLYFYKSGSFRTVVRDNISFRLDISRLIDHSIFFYKIRDVGWENLFRLLKPDFHVIDAGANMGFLTLKFSRICVDGTVYAFEADSDNFTDLSQNLGLNGFQNVRLFKTALGEKPAEGTLYKVFANNPGANRILPHRPSFFFGSETVQITTLDQYFEEGIISRVDVMKVDVEGFELFVLKGAREVIERFRPLMFIELVETNLRNQNCSSLGLIEFIEGYNYTVLDARTMLPIERNHGDHHTDVVCIPILSK